jgi:hypothetical protein
MADQEIRTVSLPFASKTTAGKFVRFAETLGYAPALQKRGAFHVVTTVFQNRADRARLLTAWTRQGGQRPRIKTKTKKTRKEKPMPDTETETPEEKPEPTPAPEPPPPNGG